jgi:hypothetical protein
MLQRDEVNLDGSMRVTFSQEENCEQSPSIVTASSLATLVEQERTTRASEKCADVLLPLQQARCAMDHVTTRRSGL